MATDSLPDTNADEVKDVGVLLRQAEEALEALRAGSKGASKPGIAAIVAMSAVEILAIGCLGVHTFLEKGGLKVDTTSVALLAAILITPFIPKLKAVELGGAKAEWQENAAAGIGDVVKVLHAHKNILDRLFQISIEESQEIEEPEASQARAMAAGRVENAAPRPLRRILWVDDQPVNNSYEIAALGSMAKVITVTDTDGALEAMKNNDIDIVISDIGRVESGRRVDDAGPALLSALRERRLTVPVFFYASTAAVRRYGAGLTEKGAMAVTSSPRDLFSALRAYEVNATRETVTNAVEKISEAELKAEVAGVDYVVSLSGGTTLGLEVGAWVTSPQMSAFADRVNRLAAAVKGKEIGKGWLLVRKEILDARHFDLAEANEIRLLSPDGLLDAMRAAN